MPPEVLNDRYELGEELGSGGMALVYRGVDRVLNRPVAIKVLASHYARDEAFVDRFRREAQAAARLNHPGIVAIFDTGSDDGTHYIVMELVEGKTLRDVLREEGPLPAERAAAITEQVATALAVAHAEGIVHRDIKPANVMLTDSGEIKVMDFGIARALGATTGPTGTSAVLGTATYLSPEQAEGKPVDARSDVYALGVFLYEILTGRPPFTGETAISVAYKHVREQPVPPTRVDPNIPSALEAVVLTALAKDPAARYQGAEAMREDLSRAVAGREVEGGPALEATAAIGTTPTATQAVTPVDRTSVMEPIGAGPQERPARRVLRPFVLAAVLVIVAAAVAIALITGGGGGGAVPVGSRTPAHPTKSKHPSPSSTPSISQSPSPPPSPTTPPPSPSPKPTHSPSPLPSLSPPPSVSPPPSPSPSALSSPTALTSPTP